MKDVRVEGGRMGKDWGDEVARLGQRIFYSGVAWTPRVSSGMLIARFLTMSVLLLARALRVSFGRCVQTHRCLCAASSGTTIIELTPE